jgi:acyl transferase domain-containing protein
MTFFSPDRVCHSFDHRANGYARGDGIGGVLLKTVRQALTNGDTIRAVIRGTGINQDGKTPGITMPSPDAQADLIRTTYAAAGLSLEKTAYFEAHGECHMM